MSGYDRSLYQMYLHQVPMFRSCSPAQIDRLAALGTAIVAEPGQAIVREGDPGEEFFVITSGAAVVQRAGSDVAELSVGDYFGELALFDPAPRDATVAAKSEVSLVALSRNGFSKALEEIPAIRDAILHGMAHRIHEFDARC